MKKILLSILFISILGCDVNGQNSGDELGITSPKSFATFIKSIESNSNILSETQTSKEYKKVINKGDRVFSIKFSVTYDQSGNKIPFYQGNIYVNTSKNGVIEKGGFSYSKSNFRYSIYKDLIIGTIDYFSGPDNTKEHNYYTSVYGFEIKKENKINKDDVESDDVESDVVKSDAEESDVVKSDFGESEPEVEKPITEINESEKYTFFGERTLFYKLSDYQNLSINNNFFTIGKYSIISNPILIQESIFWENNGDKNSLGNGYVINFNEKTMKTNDTLYYQYYKNKKKNGRIVNYQVYKNLKVPMEIGTYKDHFPVGEYTKYRIESQKGKRVLSLKSFHDQNGFTIKNTIYNSLYENNEKNPTVYIEKIVNYNPKTTKMNGVYEEYHSTIVNGNPQISISGFYTEGNRTGIWKTFFDNGQLEELINYTTGQSEKYNSDGSLIYKKYKN